MFTCFPGWAPWVPLGTFFFQLESGFRAPGWLSQLGVGLLISAQVCGFEPHVRLCADGMEPSWDSFSLPLSKQIYKLGEKKRKKKTLFRAQFSCPSQSLFLFGDWGWHFLWIGCGKGISCLPEKGREMWSFWLFPINNLFFQECVCDGLLFIFFGRAQKKILMQIVLAFFWL